MQVVALSATAIFRRASSSKQPHTPFLHKSCSAHRHVSGNRNPLKLSAESADAVHNDKVNGRKKRVVVGYKAMTTAYLAAGLQAAKASGISISSARVLGGYIALPSALSYILTTAA